MVIAEFVFLMNHASVYRSRSLNAVFSSTNLSAIRLRLSTRRQKATASGGDGLFKNKLFLKPPLVRVGCCAFAALTDYSSRAYVTFSRERLAATAAQLRQKRFAVIIALLTTPVTSQPSPRIVFSCSKPVTRWRHTGSVLMTQLLCANTVRRVQRR